MVPVVVQDAQSRDVLMLAYANQEALDLTLSSGYAHYYSRSRNQLWKKGETSGHLQEIVEIRVDCDLDTLLYLVRQTGPACHTNRFSCFYRRVLKGKFEFI
ncbi:MAG: phosphoribosyl-AMP cyclohydrolase [Spirochaetales bacterium]|nr:phosphoribosyl-AMP cyclohydrolase [Spirochaetales bacterium]